MCDKYGKCIENSIENAHTDFKSLILWVAFSNATRLAFRELVDKMQSPPADLLLSKYRENNLVKKTNAEEMG